MSAIPPEDPTTRLFLRHTLATLAYRAGKTLRGTSSEFGEYRHDAGSPRVVDILAHMGDLMDWVLTQAKGQIRWNNSTALPWEQEIERFYRSLGAVDAYLASGAPLGYDAGRMFQGGIADALTHTGQLAMLRRFSGFKMKGESYARADIEVGRVGLAQVPPDPAAEFD